MKDYPNITGVKFSTSNAVHAEQVISMANDNFQVITAVVRTFYSNLCMGVKATTTVEACPFADEIIKIYEEFDSGKLESSLISQKRLNRALEDMPNSIAKDNFFRVAEAKYILYLKGLCLPVMSSYYREVSEQEGGKIKNILNKHKILIA
jgi:4-hydroxy-tetrahydrodipicolinate synthase